MEWRNRVGEEEANKISKRASTRGNKCHKLCELYLSNEDISKYKPLIKLYDRADIINDIA